MPEKSYNLNSALASTCVIHSTLVRGEAGRIFYCPQGMSMLRQEHLTAVPLEKLELWDKNFRDIKPEAFARLKNKITELGVFKPLLAVLTPDGKYSIIGGNQRLKAYKELGLKAADVILFPDLADEKIITKITLADNQSDGDTDLEKLQNLIIELKIPEVELEDYSVSVDNISVSCALADFANDNSNPADDILPDVEADAPAKTKLGDIWQLGRHRLICADCLQKDTYAKLLQNQKPDLIFTDPPYGVNIAKNGKIGRSTGYRPILKRYIMILSNK